MNHYGVILKQLRLLNKLQIKVAAARIGRSAGWLSEVENGKGSARIHTQEFDRIVAAYGGDVHRKQFGIWVAKAHKPEAPKDLSFAGAVLKYLRMKAAKSVTVAAREAGISPCYLSYLETGVKPLPSELRDKLMRNYGYSPGSFKNFTTEDKQAKNVPVRFKLNMMLKQMDDAGIQKMLGFALSMISEKGDV